MKRDLAVDADTTPAWFLLNIVRRHEVWRYDRQFFVRPHGKAKLAARNDVRKLRKHGELADSEFFFEQVKLEFLEAVGHEVLPEWNKAEFDGKM